MATFKNDDWAEPPGGLLACLAYRRRIMQRMTEYF